MRKESLESDLENLQSKLTNCEARKPEPNMKYEQERRRLTRSLDYFWEEFKFNMQNYKNNCPTLIKEIEDFRNSAYEYKISWNANLRVMKENDGYDLWRTAEANALSELIQKRLTYIQNPKDCDNRKYIRCIAKYCGWGCQIHYYTECLILAYKLNRTVVFNQTGFLYNENGWNEFYQPASETCLKLPENFSVVKWPGPENEKVLTVTHDAEKRVKSHYPGRRLPADLAERIKKISSTPMAWFNGQIQKYFQRSTDYLKNKLKETLNNVGFDTPIVGIHVRRTDKLRGEAQNFSIEAYMEYAEEYFDQLEITQNISKRRVYICTDDPNAITELRTKYSHYEIYSNEKSATDADEYKRYSRSSFENLLHEIEILTLCSYVVCTLSSNICRLVYENFEALYSDPIKRLKSLDYNFDTAGENVQFGVAIQNHNSSDISMQIGDKLYLLAVNDTFVRDITNIRTSKSGKVPSFKVEFIVPKIKFATYPEVK